jgi:heme-degrading monooxygenase HmoA
MILESASLCIVPGQQAEFERAFCKAQTLLSGMPGYISHELQRSIERDHHYLLLVEWQTLEDHTLGFRKSTQFLRWRELLGPHFHASLEVEHFARVVTDSSSPPVVLD